MAARSISWKTSFLAMVGGPSSKIFWNLLNNLFATDGSHKNTLSPDHLGYYWGFKYQPSIYTYQCIIVIKHASLGRKSVHFLLQQFCVLLNSGLVHGQVQTDDPSLKQKCLKRPLSGTISAVEGQGVAMFIAHDLNLQMPSLGDHLHQEDGRARHLCEDVGEGYLQLLASDC